MGFLQNCSQICYSIGWCFLNHLASFSLKLVSLFWELLLYSFGLFKTGSQAKSTAIDLNLVDTISPFSRPRPEANYLTSLCLSLLICKVRMMAVHKLFIFPPTYLCTHSPSTHPHNSSTYPPTHSSTHLFIHPSIHPSIYPSPNHLPTHSSTHPSNHLSTHPSIHPSIQHSTNTYYIPILFQTVGRHL